jgi:hypothetical protein
VACKNPTIAFEFIKQIVTAYLEFYSEKLESDLNKTHPKTMQQLNQTKESSLGENELQESNQFREWLDKRGKTDVYSFTWKQINSLVNE